MLFVCTSRQPECPNIIYIIFLHFFAIETSGVFGPEALSFLRELGRRIKAETGEPRSLQFLLQGIAVAVQGATRQQCWALHPPQTLFTFNYGADTAVPLALPTSNFYYYLFINIIYFSILLYIISDIIELLYYII